jgi:hypothetical protein
MSVIATYDTGRCQAREPALRHNAGDILGRRALPLGRLARLGATLEFHHGLLVVSAVVALVLS